MGSIWLHDLPDVARGAGLEVRCWPGWETRSRSSGGYDAVAAVFCHHTASSAAPDADAAYMWDNSDNRPIGAVLLERSGRVTVGAAGATNTQGKGGPLVTSTCTIPLDKGNTYGVAIEAANNGTGEAWPDAQQDAYVVLVAALCDAYGLDVSRDVFAHFEWAPGRKIDPAGPSRWATGTASWDMNAFRECLTDGEEEDVTDEDIKKIAKAVWDYILTDLSVNKPTPAGKMLEYTRQGAANADVHTAKEVWEYKTRTLTK